jgi:hypothetical protein
MHLPIPNGGQGKGRVITINEAVTAVGKKIAEIKSNDHHRLSTV